MPKHTITVSDHELEVLKYILTTYETMITNVKYRKWKQQEAIQDLNAMKLAVSKSRQAPVFQDA